MTGQRGQNQRRPTGEQRAGVQELDDRALPCSAVPETMTATRPTSVSSETAYVWSLGMIWAMPPAETRISGTSAPTDQNERSANCAVASST